MKEIHPEEEAIKPLHALKQTTQCETGCSFIPILNKLKLQVSQNDAFKSILWYYAAIISGINQTREQTNLQAFNMDASMSD